MSTKLENQIFETKKKLQSLLALQAAYPDAYVSKNGLFVCKVLDPKLIDKFEIVNDCKYGEPGLNISVYCSNHNMKVYKNSTPWNVGYSYAKQELVIYSNELRKIEKYEKVFEDILKYLSKFSLDFNNVSYKGVFLKSKSKSKSKLFNKKPFYKDFYKDSSEDFSYAEKYKKIIDKYRILS